MPQPLDTTSQDTWRFGAEWPKTTIELHRKYNPDFEANLKRLPPWHPGIPGKGMIVADTDEPVIWGDVDIDPQDYPEIIEKYPGFARIPELHHEDVAAFLGGMFLDKAYIQPDGSVSALGDPAPFLKADPRLHVEGKGAWHFGVSDTNPSVFYHVAPRAARQSILQHGLRGADYTHEGPWANADWDWRRKQPHGNYMFGNIEEAQDYATNLAQREWENTNKEPEPESYDLSWDDDGRLKTPDGESYDPDNEAHAAQAGHPGFDIWRVFHNPDEHSLRQDPENALSDEHGEWGSGTGELSQAEALHEIRQFNEENGADHDDSTAWDYVGDREPMRWYTPEPIHPKHLNVEEHHEPWNIDEDRNYYNEVPMPLTRVPFNRYFGASHVSNDETPPMPTNPASYNSALKLKDGTWRVWDTGDAHMVYAHKQGIPFEAIESFWGWSPHEQQWTDYTPKNADAYKDIYEELGSGRIQWSFGTPPKTSNEFGGPYTEAELTQAADDRSKWDAPVIRDLIGGYWLGDSGELHEEMADRLGIPVPRYDQRGVVYTDGVRWYVDNPDQWRFGDAQHQQRSLSYHLTENPQFALDPEFHPANNTTWGGDWPHKGIFVGNPSSWFDGRDYVRPYVAEIEHPPITKDFGGYSGEQFLPAEQFQHSQVKRLIPFYQWQKEQYGEGHEGLEVDDGDVRDWSPEQVAAYKEKLNDYIKTQKPHMLTEVCPNCGSDYVSPGKPCPKCGYETDRTDRFYSKTASLQPFPEYLLDNPDRPDSARLVPLPWKPGELGKALAIDGRVYAWVAGHQPYNNDVHHYNWRQHEPQMTDENTFDLHPDGEIVPSMWQKDLSPTTREGIESIKQALPGTYHTEQGWHFGAYDPDTPWRVQESDFDPANSALDNPGGNYWTHSPFIGDPSTHTIYLGQPGVHHHDLIQHHWDKNTNGSFWRDGDVWGMVNNGMISVGNPSPGGAGVDPRVIADALHRHLGPGFSDDIDHSLWDFESKTAAGHEAQRLGAFNPELTYRHGTEGKALVFHDGTVRAWNVDEEGSPHHDDMWRGRDDPRSFHYINTKGHVLQDAGREGDDEIVAQAIGGKVAPDDWLFEGAARKNTNTGIYQKGLRLNDGTERWWTIEPSFPMVGDTPVENRHEFEGWPTHAAYMNDNGIRDDDIAAYLHRGPSGRVKQWRVDDPGWRFATNSKIGPNLSTATQTPEGMRPWTEGREGKGFYLKDGRKFTWAVTRGWDHPHHTDAMMRLGIDPSEVANYIWMIYPDGRELTQTDLRNKWNLSAVSPISSTNEVKQLDMAPLSALEGPQKPDSLPREESAATTLLHFLTQPPTSTPLDNRPTAQSRVAEASSERPQEPHTDHAQYTERISPGTHDHGLREAHTKRPASTGYSTEMGAGLSGPPLGPQPPDTGSQESRPSFKEFLLFRDGGEGVPKPKNEISAGSGTVFANPLAKHGKRVRPGIGVTWDGEPHAKGMIYDDGSIDLWPVEQWSGDPHHPPSTMGTRFMIDTDKAGVPRATIGTLDTQPALEAIRQAHPLLSNAELNSAWHFGAWPGFHGRKGLVFPDGNVDDWLVNEQGYPHHTDHPRFEEAIGQFWTDQGQPTELYAADVYDDDGYPNDDAMETNWEKAKQILERKGYKLDSGDQWKFGAAWQVPFNQWHFGTLEDLRDPWWGENKIEDEDDRGRYPIMQYANGHTLLGPEGSQHYDILNLNEDWDDRSGRAHGFVQTYPDAPGYLEWYDKPFDHEGAMAELSKLYPGLESDPDANSWNFSKVAALRKWELGLNGKGLVLPDGSALAWATDNRGDPHHEEVGRQYGHDELWGMGMFQIDTNGDVFQWSGTPEDAQKFYAFDPDLHPHDQPWAWKFGSLTPEGFDPWIRGGSDYGKALVKPDGRIEIWKTDGADGFPTHDERIDPGDYALVIDPAGNVRSLTESSYADHIAQNPYSAKQAVEMVAKAIGGTPDHSETWYFSAVPRKLASAWTVKIADPEAKGQADPHYGWRRPIIADLNTHTIYVGNKGDYHYNLTGVPASDDYPKGHFEGEIDGTSSDEIEGFISGSNELDPSRTPGPEIVQLNWSGEYLPEVAAALKPYFPNVEPDLAGESGKWNFSLGKVAAMLQSPTIPADEEHMRPAFVPQIWRRGKWGKAYVSRDGTPYAWVDQNMEPTPDWDRDAHHSDVMHAAGNEAQNDWGGAFHIDNEGHVIPALLGDKGRMKILVDSHPDLWATDDELNRYGPEHEKYHFGAVQIQYVQGPTWNERPEMPIMAHKGTIYVGSKGTLHSQLYGAIGDWDEETARGLANPEHNTYLWLDHRPDPQYDEYLKAHGWKDESDEWKFGGWADWKETLSDGPEEGEFDPWQSGQRGKGLVLDDGSVRTWGFQQLPGSFFGHHVRHPDYGKRRNFMEIAPDGTYSLTFNDPEGYGAHNVAADVAAVKQHDPRLQFEQAWRFSHVTSAVKPEDLYQQTWRGPVDTTDPENYYQPWESGHYGKGMILSDGTVLHWRTPPSVDMEDADSAPTHFDMIDDLGLLDKADKHSDDTLTPFWITPAGDLHVANWGAHAMNHEPVEKALGVQADDRWKFAGLPWDMPSKEVAKKVNEYWSASCPNCGAEWTDTERAGYLGSMRYCRKCHHEWGMDPNSILQDDPPLPPRSEKPEIFESGSGEFKQYDADKSPRRPAIYIPKLNHIYVGAPGAFHTDIHSDFKHLDNHELEDDRLEGYVGKRLGEFWDTTMQKDEAPPEVLEAMKQRYGVPFRNESERPSQWTFGRKKIAVVRAQWGGNPEDADPLNGGEYPVLYDGATGELLVGHEGLHHGDVKRHNSGYFHGVAATAYNPHGGGFAPNTLGWLDTTRPENENEIIQAVSNLIGARLRAENEEEKNQWVFASENVLPSKAKPPIEAKLRAKGASVPDLVRTNTPTAASVNAQETPGWVVQGAGGQEAEPDRNTQVVHWTPEEIPGGSLVDENWDRYKHYADRSVLVHDPRFNTLHIAPPGYAHSELTEAIRERYYPDGRDGPYNYGWVGYNPEGDGTYGWYTPPKNDLELRTLLQKQHGLTYDQAQDKWHFGWFDGDEEHELHDLPDWQPGTHGKGMAYREITNLHDRDADDEYGPWKLKAWPVDSLGHPHHIDVMTDGMETGPEIFIDPSGKTDTAWWGSDRYPGGKELPGLIDAHPYLQPAKGQGEYMPYEPHQWKFAVYGDSKYNPKTQEWEPFESWEPGSFGKGILFKNVHGEPWNQIEHWKVDELGVEDDEGYHHDDMAEYHGLRGDDWLSSFEISPHGVIDVLAYPKDRETHAQEITKLDPRLRWEGDRWHFGVETPNVVNGNHNIIRSDGSNFVTAPWEPGRPGKGVYVDGKLHLWAQEGGIEPHHDDIFAHARGIDAYHENSDWDDYYAAPKIYIDPSGEVTHARMGKPKDILGIPDAPDIDFSQFDPRLHNPTVDAWSFT